MFNFIGMEDDYDDRKVVRDDYEWGFISTVSVPDGRKDYETAVEHPDYRNGEMVIVDCYDTKEKALKGHAKWVKTMENPPSELTDCANSEIAQAIVSSEGEQVFKRKHIE